MNGPSGVPGAEFPGMLPRLEMRPGQRLVFWVAAIAVLAVAVPIGIAVLALLLLLVLALGLIGAIVRLVVGVTERGAGAIRGDGRRNVRVVMPGARPSGSNG